MSTVFDFTYTLNSETTQNEVLYNSTATAAKIEYAPTSHFFVDESKLLDTVATNYTTDAFGPVTGSLTTKYRTTSKVRTNDTNPVKVFAICKGQVLIQPQTGDDTKVNLILKPEDSYAPLKIKYFIYRGINKADLIGNNILKSVVDDDVNQPVFLNKLWKQYIAFNTSLKDPSTGENFPTPTEFPSALIGYDENQPDTTLIENYFTKKEINISYQIPSCKAGEHLGNFTGEIGLDIVLDHGDYQLQNQEELFKFDLTFARKKEHVFDTAKITSSTPVKEKRYKEYIHQFMDAAAFWGSHMECGTIKTTASEISKTEGLKKNIDIFTNIVTKYQTKNKIYVYIQGENNRSYNYFDNARKVYGFSPTGQLNNTSGWPIIIEELTVTVSNPPVYSTGITFNLEYNIDTRIPESERHIVVDIISPNNKTSAYPLLEKPLNPIAPATIPAFLIRKTSSNTTKFQVNGTKSCATFLMFYGNLKQEFPLKNYYNDLFPANFNTNFLLPATETDNMSSWATYDKSRMVNLDDVLGVGAIIQNKLVFDNGKGTAVSGISPRKPRRLYMAIVKRNSDHSTEYNSLNIDTITSGINKITTTQEQYALNIYNDVDFSVYKGAFSDNGAVNSLTLIHEKSLIKRNSFFHLGITDEEYNKLMYGQITAPIITPPATIPQFLPIDADNVFFHLEEVIDFPKPNVQKFKLGFRFENAAGNITISFPTTNNEVYVYTIDGFYFFSKEYSNFQEFTSTFAKALVEFRTVPSAIPANGSNPAIPAYNGEFGFDWLRLGDNGESSYESSIVGGYERPTTTDTTTEYEYNGTSSTIFNDAAKALKREYTSIPTQATMPDDQYFVSYLNLFSKTYSDSLPATISPKPPYEATLRVLVQIDEAVGKLEFDYNTSYFAIDKPVLSDKTVTIGKVESNDKTIKITCLSDFSETQQIKVLAYPVGVTDKKQAKLAGIIQLGINDSNVRKDMKFVLINVMTNVDGLGIKTGSILQDEKEYFINALSHMFITAKLENGPNLDLSSVADYKTGGRFIYANGGLWEDAPNHSFFTDLRTRFLSMRDSSGSLINSKFTDYFTVFSFDTPPYDSTAGQIQDIGVHNLILFPNKTSANPYRGDRTWTHEALHGLGLYHTHRDGAITEPEKKYVYPKYNSVASAGTIHISDATDNFMSYASDLRKSSWKWQWKIIKSKL